MADALLRCHDTVIIDACNVTKKRRDEWEGKHLADIEFYPILTSPSECINRANLTRSFDIVSVIERMAEQWDYPERWD
jgi:hypothetical protein